MNTIDDMVKKIQSNINWFVTNDKTNKCLNKPLTGSKGSELLIKRIDDICKVYKDFVINEQMDKAAANNNLNRMLIEEGMIYEALGYYWLMQTSISPFLTPLYITNNNIYGKDVELDGCIDDSVAFDIKKFQNYSEILSSKLTELNKKYTNYVFMPAGQTDLPKEQFFDNTVIHQIEDAIKKGKQSTQITLPNQGTILMKKTERINMSESIGNPFLWCQNNYKLFLSDCHQFTKDKPFLLIEIADLQKYEMGPIGTYMLLRTMVRRTFFELKNVTEPVSMYDKKVNDDCSVGETMKYLSAIMFIDVNSGRSFAFMNPFTTNKMKRNYLEYYGWDNQITIDDFGYDSY